MLDMTRQERLQAAEQWATAYRYTHAHAVAQALVDVISKLEQPTVKDLFSFIGEGAYDLDDHFRVDVTIGDLVGCPGLGPTVDAVVDSLSNLDRAELDHAIGQRLVSLL